MRAWLGHLSRAIGSRLPNALAEESICARAYRHNPHSILCRLLDTALGAGHCEEEAAYLKKDEA